MDVYIRATKTSDYPAINAIGTAYYPKNYHEGDESFESKMRGYPEGSFVADLDGVVGYTIAFPYVLGRHYPANEPYTKTINPDCYYIHDLCVHPDFRRRGIATRLAKTVLTQTDWKIIALVAVMSSGSFWRTLGFRGFGVIRYYGRKAEYMLLIRD